LHWKEVAKPTASPTVESEGKKNAVYKKDANRYVTVPTLINMAMRRRGQQWNRPVQATIVI
jgi:hypothetical protein